MSKDNNAVLGWTLIVVFAGATAFFAWPDYSRMSDIGIGGFIAAALAEWYRYDTTQPS